MPIAASSMPKSAAVPCISPRTISGSSDVPALAKQEEGEGANQHGLEGVWELRAKRKPVRMAPRKRSAGSSGSLTSAFPGEQHQDDAGEGDRVEGEGQPWSDQADDQARQRRPDRPRHVDADTGDRHRIGQVFLAYQFRRERAPGGHHQRGADTQGEG
ncbi:hypothetical protein L1887_51781 [Cichorium endivia]|nr:hypothetical protein L1887_51781 [Cichorium endivia]